MNSSTIFDRSLLKDKFKEIYNKKSYKFPINNVFLSNIKQNGKIVPTDLTKLVFGKMQMIMKID